MVLHLRKLDSDIIFEPKHVKTDIVVGALVGLLRVIDGSPLKALVSLH